MSETTNKRTRTLGDIQVATVNGGGTLTLLADVYPTTVKAMRFIRQSAPPGVYAVVRLVVPPHEVKIVQSRQTALWTPKP